MISEDAGAGWSPLMDPRRIPVGPDAAELDRVILRLQALVDVRADATKLDQAQQLVDRIEVEIRDALESPTKHRAWTETRLRVIELMDDLGEVLYWHEGL